jgi:putative tricarboxylic transport membrane protein
MSDNLHAVGPRHRWVELGMTLLTAMFAVVVIFGSVKAGHGWAFDGPQAGFFPFYVGLFILGASAVNFFHAWMERDTARPFAEWAQLWQVVSVLIPAAIYVVLVPLIGIYAASMILIAAFMKWFGRYAWIVVLPIAIGVPIVTFIVFERWFLVPLPKGPIEELLGF